MHRASKWTVTASTLVLAAGIGWTCSSGSDSPTQPGPPSGVTVTVNVDDNFFDPKSITISPGDTVRWVLDGTDPTHTVTERDEDFDSGFVFQSPGDSFEITFEESGETYEYWCRTHKDEFEMQGSVRVGAGAPPPSPGY